MISHILTNQNMHALNMLSGVSIWSGLAIYNIYLSVERYFTKLD